MPNTTVLTKSKYQKLLTDLRKLIQEGKKRAQGAVSRELIATYWHVGKRITQESLTENAGYGESVTEDIAQDLGMDMDTLRKSILFFKRYENKSPRALDLSWSHYRALLSIQSDEERAWYEAEAIKHGWIRDELVSAIKRDVWLEGKAKGRKMSRKLKRPTDSLYTYKAIVERVVDGDTLLLRIDLGFQVWKEQRVRLAEIDAPEKDTKEGRKAFEHVRDTLARVQFVVIKTNKIDIYGRYVAHVFYSFGQTDKEKIFTDGRYLNQELLNRHH